MIEFYLYPNSAMYIVDVLLSFIIIAQIMLINATSLKLVYKYKYNAEFALEILLLVHIFIKAFIIACIQWNAYRNNIVEINLDIIEYVLIAAIWVACFAVNAEEKALSIWVAAVAVSINLPLIRYLRLPYSSYIHILSAALIFGRAIVKYIRLSKELKYKFSFLSIKEAIDKLEVPVMFCNDKSHIVLSNFNMEELMKSFTGRIYRNGAEFIKELEQFRFKEYGNYSKEDDLLICRAMDGNVWRFKKSYIKNKKIYTELVATDITKEWEFIEQLHTDKKLLQQKSEAIKDEINHRRDVLKQEEELRARIRIHDVLGQRIAFFLHEIRNGQNVDFEALEEIGEILKTAIKKEHNDVHIELESLKRLILNMGIELNIQGELPSDENKARVFMDILSEAVSNAIRHAFANKIDISFDEDEHYYKMGIVNDGFESGSKRIGGGISEMKRKVRELDGSLSIAYNPFSIKIVVKR